MKETRVRCLSCNIGNNKHEVTGETMHSSISRERLMLRIIFITVSGDFGQDTI